VDNKNNNNNNNKERSLHSRDF